MSDSNTIMGFIPKSKYVQYTYWLLLASAGGGLLISLLAMLGVLLPFGGLFTLCGIAALVLGLLGFFVFKEEFSTLDQSHLMYIAILFGVFLLINIVLGATFYTSTVAMRAVSLIVSVGELLLVWTGYNSWTKSRTITKDNIKSEIQLAIKRN